MNGFSFRKTDLLRVLLFACLCCAIDGFGASKKSPISLMVDDKTEKSEDEQEDISEDGNGDEITTLTESETEICTLTVRIQNKGEQPQACQMEWYFISEQMQGDELEKVIFQCGKKDLSLPVDSEIEETVTSNPFVFTTVSKDRGDVDDQETGDVYEGFIVLLTSEGKVLVGKGSSARYLKPEWLDKCSKARRMMSL